MTEEISAVTWTLPIYTNLKALHSDTDTQRETFVILFHAILEYSKWAGLHSLEIEPEYAENRVGIVLLLFTILHNFTGKSRLNPFG